VTPDRSRTAALLAATAVVLILTSTRAVAQFPFPIGGYGSAIRFQVTPRQTEVFIDGYYAGVVDDFDGFFQRLRLPPGQYGIELYLAGYRSAQQKILVQPGATFRVRHTMEPLKPGDTPDPRPVPEQKGSQP
jgi:hypothetical protein